MKVLVVGSGGREHALVWKLSQSLKVKALYCAPGNPGMTGLAELVNISSDDIPSLKDFALKNNINLTVVGPEAPLVEGITDDFEAAGLLVAGPSAAGAQLEGSKSFSKDIMARAGVPTAAYKVFTDVEQARDYCLSLDRPMVVKADGLAAGKGVLMCQSAQEAADACKQIMEDRAFGDAGDKIVVEEWLQGEEASFLVFTDGETIVPMPSSQDHKAVGEGDTGPNTGGMGAYSPAPVVTPDMATKAMEQVIRPVLETMKADGNPFKGILYAGLMISSDGIPNVLEFNVRFGDPECQPLLMRLDSDLADILFAIAKGNLSDVEVKWSPRPTVCVVLASGGYPSSYEKGYEISGIAEANAMDDVYVFHAGTSLSDGKLVNTGGRVLGVTAIGDTVRQSIEKAYSACDKISWKDMYLRRDIGHRALAREESGPLVGIVMGSPNDWDVMKSAVKQLNDLGISNEVRILSAHRTPELAAEYSKTAASRGIKAIIAGAGWAAHLAGAMAAHTILPIIGVPIGSSQLDGLDALLSTVQMPPGIPVATVAIGSGGAKNAAVLAAQIIATGDPEIAAKLHQERQKMAENLSEAEKNLKL